MCEHAEKRSPSIHKSPNRKSVQQAQPSVATPGYLPNESRMSESPYQMCGHDPAGINRKFTMFEELIPRPLPKDLVKQLMDIIDAAVATSDIIAPDQKAALEKKLIQETRSISTADTPRDLLAILFEEMMQINIPLVPAFVNNIKQGCKAYMKTLNGDEIDTPGEVRLFLKQWSPLISDRNFDMKQGSPTKYQYGDKEKTTALLSEDCVSTTEDPDASNKRRDAADLACTQASEPLDEEKLLQTLLNLNAIYSPQDKRPYRQGFRFFPAQIGQGDNAIFTTSAIKVESSVKAVIQ